MLRDWGQEKKYHHVLKGYNYRMEGMQGAILRVKLRHLERWTEARRAHAAAYQQAAAPTAASQTPDRGAVRAARLPRLRRAHRRPRGAAARRCRRTACQTGIHYPIPVHLQPAYADLGHGAGDFPHSERAANEVLSLPMYPGADATTQIEQVCCRGAGRRPMSL